MSDKVNIRLDSEVHECLMDHARHEGFGSVKAWLDSVADRMGNGGYRMYIRRRRAWYRTHLEDYIESKEYCDLNLFDFNKFARSKLVTDHRRIKRY